MPPPPKEKPSAKAELVPAWAFLFRQIQAVLTTTSVCGRNGLSSMNPFLEPLYTLKDKH